MSDLPLCLLESEGEQDDAGVRAKPGLTTLHGYLGPQA